MWAASCASLWRDAHAGRLTAGMAPDAYPVRLVPPRPTPHSASGGGIVRVGIAPGRPPRVPCTQGLGKPVV